MGNKISDILGGITVKIGLVLIAMAALTATVVVLSISVFGTIQRNISILESKYLPALFDTETVISAANDLQAKLSDLVLSTTPTQLADTVAVLDPALQSMSAAIALLPAEEGAALGENFNDLRRLLADVANARAAEFDAADQSAQSVETLKVLENDVFSQLLAASEISSQRILSGGDVTIERVNDNLKQVIDEDFKPLRLLLGAQSEINLLSGLAIALTETRDSAMAATIKDVARSHIEGLGAIVPQMMAIKSLETIAPKAEEARKLFQKVVNASGPQIATRRNDILGLRQSVETSFATVHDKLVSALFIDASQTGVQNGIEVRQLLQNEVERLAAISALRSATRRLTVDALTVGLATQADELGKSEANLAKTVSELQDLLSREDVEVQKMFAPILEFTTPLGGITASARVFLEARQKSELLEAQATTSEELIVENARRLTALASERIAEGTTLIREDSVRAEAQIWWVVIASIAVLIAAPLFAYLGVVRPIVAVTAATERLATGDLGVVARLGRGRGEIGRMIAALGVFRDGLIEKSRLEAEERAGQAAREEAVRTTAAERSAREEREREIAAAQDRRDREREAAEQTRREAAQATADAEQQARTAAQERVVSELARGLKKLADGDLRTKITAEFGAGYDQLRLDFNAAIGTLETTIGQVLQSVHSIHAGSGEISNANDDLSRRTERTAATLEQSAAALTELTASVTSAAAGAAEAHALVSTVRQSAARSNDVVNEAVVAMGEIETSSRKISKITGVIDDIAFQTNLLALNAGVEAARAGDAGRGFAVVASEVRALAQRSSEAAREINGLISDSGIHVSRGVERVDHVGRALREIVASIADISGHVAAIAASTREQSSGISEINIAIGQLDQTTQQNAAMVQETTAAGHSLTEEASSLSQTVSRFVLGAAWTAEPTRSQRRA